MKKNKTSLVLVKIKKSDGDIYKGIDTKGKR